MRGLLDRLRSAREPEDCGCEPAVDGDALVVDAGACPASGVLADSGPCRATVVDALARREVDAVLSRADGRERAYLDDAAALLVAAGRFVEAAAFHDERLAARAGRDPLGAAREAAGRSGPVATVAAESGLLEGAHRVEGYREALRPYVGPTVSRSRVAARLPPGARLEDERALDTGATVRIYRQAGAELRTYHLEPVEHGLGADTVATLATAHERLASGAVGGGERAPGRAVRRVAGPADPVSTLRSVLRKHTRGLGVLEDLFADPAVSDVFATDPVDATPLRVRVDGTTMRTNVRLTADGAAALASRFRRTSGRAFSRASPTLDALATPDGRQVRVAGVTAPASRDLAFAFRAHEREAWTLPALVANGTLPTGAAGLLSLAVERGVAALLAGTRGAGKTTLLGALLWELPAETRTVVIEDTPELPVAALQAAGRDVQALRVADEDGPGLAPAEALRTALRLGDGALVVGEVRGEEASVLYEAMRVGANGSAVLGTIHGDGGEAVRERVVTDLGVPASSFGATDLLVTLESTDTPDGRRVAAIEEVVAADGVRFEHLYERGPDGLVSTGRIERGNSHVVDALHGPAGSYAGVREALEARGRWLEERAEAADTDPRAVVAAHARRRESC